jgi:hypothetical protein
MATGAMTGLGTVLSINAGSGYVDMAEVFDITAPNETTKTIDATHYGSTAQEFILGLPDNGECVFKLNWIPSNATEDLILGIPRGTPVPIRITWPNGITWTFNGIRTGFQPTAPIEDRMTANVTFKVTGSVIRT